MDGLTTAGLNHDLIALTGGGWEVLSEQTDRCLGVGVREAESRVELASCCTTQPDENNRSQEPEHYDAAPVVETPMS